MNIGYRWLTDLLDGLTASPAEVADRLAASGAPVDDIVDLGAGLAGIVVARVDDVRRHPNADRLSLCVVDAGGPEPLSVVCGAPNVRAGGLYPFAPVGAALPGGMCIGRAKIRGEVSEGMLCSESELELGHSHDGLLEIAGDAAPGTRFVEALGLDDARLVVDVTANRPDLLSHAGVARELAAFDLGRLRLPEGERSLRLEAGKSESRAAGVSVRIEAPDLCPRYLGAVVRGVRVGASPDWLRGRLRSIGVRPINNVVDATNYVLHELGQPLHAFDLARLRGEQIVVRRARGGESLVTLDGERRALTDSMLVIADAERAVAVAGVMGGEDSEVRPETTDLLIECALFEPRSVRATRRSLGLSTDASYRYERGVDPEGMERALRRAVELIGRTAGGEAAASVADAQPRPWTAARVPLRPERAAHLLGVPLSEGEVVARLAALGFDRVEADGSDPPLFRVPGSRSYDVTREVDLIEEVARHHGYESFPDELRPFRPSAVPDDEMARLEDRLRALFVGRGFLEAHLGGLAPESEGDVALVLPLSSAESRLRRALLPGLIHRVEHNFARGTGDVRLFEIGTAFAPGETLPLETRRLAVVLAGARRPPHWSGPAPAFDVWDASGLLAELAETLGLEPPAPAGAAADLPAYLDAPRAYTVAGPSVGVAPVALAGPIAAAAIDAPRWAPAVYGLEVVLTPAMAERPHARYRPLPEYPAIERDLALLVPAGVSAAVVEETIREAAGDLLEAVHPFDLYTGAGVAAGRRSIAYRLRLRSAERTLTDEEADGRIGRVLRALEERLDVGRRE